MRVLLALNICNDWLKVLMMKSSQSLLEYILILGVISLAVTTIMGNMSTSISGVANSSNSKFDSESISDYCRRIGKSYDSTNGLCK